MKCLKSLFPTLMICLIVFGCTNEDIDENTVNESSNKNYNSPNYPIKSTTELIVEYQSGFPERKKEDLRKKYNVKRYEKCDCTNSRIEKWEFDPRVDLEGRNELITQEGGIEGTDYQFFYDNENSTPGVSGSTAAGQSDLLISSYIKASNSGVTIAILDTGINLTRLPQSYPFLYGTNSDMTLCEEGEETEVSGWDFVNHDNDVYDDNGHGTVVTSIIIDKLFDEDISDYQILPVKAFNDLGKTTTFTLLCSYLYAVDKPSVSVINMSFGWYGPSGSLFPKFILENPDILHITSSGNDGINNDDNVHYPSSYTSNNILGIGSFSIKKRKEIVEPLPFDSRAMGISLLSPREIIKSTFSNFGVTSVDFLSVGDQVSFYDNNGNHYLVSGTSYAAPLVTAKAAMYYQNGHITPTAITEQLRLNGTLLAYYSLPIYYGDRIIE
ncbi:S8 family peptidase [Aquimarina sediminis]|uniref:S8 family peptidase n=1 Tax=Aquimarina sediminis TaxID=2070536 RepID=UPI000C9FFF2B|nr:S8 family serine peptidase [Aquimarina sediminis]